MQRHVEIKLDEGPAKLIVMLSNTGGNPLLVTCTDTNGQSWFWRLTNSDKIPIFLPYHPDELTVSVSEGGGILSVLIAELVPPVIPYFIEHGEGRNYRLEDFQFRKRYDMEGPARMYPHTPLIEYNPDILRKYPKPVQVFVFKHEMAHYWYDDEKLADTWALISFLNEGWNLSMASYALNHVLHNTQLNRERVELQFDLIKELEEMYYE